MTERISRQPLECVQLAAALETWVASESGSQLRALQTLGAVAAPRSTFTMGKEALDA